ncbi:MAG: flagellar basal body P-ring formation protein FlgA [Gammaproteobacteria bacterium]|nr:flagellar basal body P-ring formation protein FlgA [Gammaproteobacteria bacterium]
MNAAELQDLGAIRERAVEFAKTQLRATHERIEVQAGKLDPWLRLAQCDDSLTPFLPAGTRVNANLTVGIRCEGRTNWTVYIPVRIAAYVSVLVTDRAIARGQRISSAEVTKMERRVSGIAGGYLTNSAELAGKVATRTINPGTVLTKSLLKEEILIQRGQTVMLLSHNDMLEVRARGKALDNGVLAARIRVQNLTSQRVVEGIVKSPDTVEVRW